MRCSHNCLRNTPKGFPNPTVTYALVASLFEGRHVYKSQTNIYHKYTHFKHIKYQSKHINNNYSSTKHKIGLIPRREECPQTYPRSPPFEDTTETIWPHCNAALAALGYSCTCSPTAQASRRVRVGCQVVQYTRRG